MLERGKISCTQTVYLLVNLVGATAIVFLPAITARDAGRDAWLVPVVTTLPGIYLALVIVALGRRYPGQTLFQYLQAILGTWPGKAAGLFYLFFFLHTNSLIVREFGELMVSMVMPRTPLLVFHVLILLLCAWAIRGGLEVLARVMELTWPVITFLFSVTIALTISQVDLNRLLPLLENGFMPVINASLAPTGWRGEIILLAMFLPFMAKPREGKRCAILAVVAVGLILTTDAVFNTAVLGPSVARMTFPTFSLVRMVSVANFLERIDAVLVTIWVVSMFGKIALFYYATVIGAAQLVGLGDYRPVVVPVGVILAALSILVAENSRELVEHIARFWPLFAYLFEYIIPTILLVAAAIKASPSKN